MATGFWKGVRGGTSGSRVFAGYVALVLMVAMAGPGLSVYAAESVVKPASEATITPTVETPVTAPVVEPAPVVPEAPAPVVAPVAEPAPAPAPVAAPAPVVEPAPAPEAAVAPAVVTAPTVAATAVSEAPKTVEVAKPVATASVVVPKETVTIAPVVAAPVIAATVPSTSSNTQLTLEGLRKTFGWTTGNLHTWLEGEWVPYRLIIENTDKVNSISIPAIHVTMDYYTAGAVMYDETRDWGYYIQDSKPGKGDTGYPSTTALSPSEHDVAIDSNSHIRTSFGAGDIVVPKGKYAVLYWQTHLALTSEWSVKDPPRNGAGFVPGSSGHGQLDMTGVGAKTVPAPSVPKPEEPVPGNLTILKFEDTNGNGVHNPGEAMLSDWDFTLYDAEDVEVGTGTTDANGELSFTNLTPGVYHATETLKGGWTNTTPLTQEVAVVEGETAELWFGNKPILEEPKVGSILVHKFLDTNGNGVHDPGEAMLEDWTFDYTQVDMLDPLVGSGSTDANGELLFSDLPIGNYDVTETLKDGWTNTTPLVQSAEVTDGGTAELWFGNKPIPEEPKLGSILVHKFLDTNGNGVHDPGEAMLEDWTFDYTQTGVQDPAVGSGSTDANGEVKFSDLPIGDYNVTETLKAGWINTTPLLQSTEVTDGDIAELWFGNKPIPEEPKLGSLIVHKYLDENSNGTKDAGEAMLAGWSFEIRNGADAVVGTGVTNAAGSVLFTGLAPGTYTATETLKDGWTNTTPLTQTILVTAGGVAELWFGNVEEFLPFTELDLEIHKKASVLNAKPGQLITYTLTYWNNGDLAAENYKIVDHFDSRYVSVVDAAGGTVLGDTITWTFAGPLAHADGKKTLSYTLRVKATMPAGTTRVDNTVVIEHPNDADPTNNTSRAHVNVKVVTGEPFLPFTGSEYVLLIALALAAGIAGLVLRLVPKRVS